MDIAEKAIGKLIAGIKHVIDQTDIQITFHIARKHDLCDRSKL